MPVSNVIALAPHQSGPEGLRPGAATWFRAWLLLLIALVLVMVTVGGATRLTGSGLSITEWKPILGAIPPLTEADWLKEFALYRDSPQYRLLNSGMALGEFKFIYWWEWGHRQLGRFIGLVMLGGRESFGAGGYLGRGQVIDASKPILRTFPRWALNAEAAFHHRFGHLGETRLLAEGLVGASMDRSTLPAIPASLSIAISPLHQYRFFVRAEQEVTRWASFGVRYDVYSPDSSQGGNHREALSLLGVAHLADGLKVMLEYDRTVDNTHKTGAALPSKHTDSLSAVAQAKF